MENKIRGDIIEFNKRFVVRKTFEGVYGNIYFSHRKTWDRHSDDDSNLNAQQRAKKENEIMDTLGFLDRFRQCVETFERAEKARNSAKNTTR